MSGVVGGRAGRSVAVAGVAVVAGAVLVVLLVLVARGHIGWARRADGRLIDSLNRYIAVHGTQVRAWKIVTDAGGPLTWRVLALVAVVVLAVRRRWREAVVVAVAMIGAAVLSGPVKVLVGRHRPVVPDPVFHANGASFPSGHAVTSFVAWGLLVVLVGPGLDGARRVALALVAAVVVAVVAFSRMILGVHYLTDILGGWVLGALWLAFVLTVARARPVVRLRS